MSSRGLAIAVVVGIGVALVLALSGVFGVLSMSVAAQPVAPIPNALQETAQPLLSNGLSSLYVSTAGVEVA